MVLSIQIEDLMGMEEVCLCMGVFLLGDGGV